jgi:hypothetical protein
MFTFENSTTLPTHILCEPKWWIKVYSWRTYTHYGRSTWVVVRSLILRKILLPLLYLVGFEAVIAVVMRSPISWDVTFCSSFEVNWSFQGTHRQARKEQDAGSSYSLALLYVWIGLI